jgi:hypothetical protein
MKFEGKDSLERDGAADIVIVGNETCDNASVIKFLYLMMGMVIMMAMNPMMMILVWAFLVNKFHLENSEMIFRASSAYVLH